MYYVKGKPQDFDNWDWDNLPIIRKTDILLSSGGIRSIWLKHGLRTFDLQEAINCPGGLKQLKKVSLSGQTNQRLMRLVWRCEDAALGTEGNQVTGD